MKTIAVLNQKGGVGKTTTAQALGAGLHKRGASVLFIDLDAQGNLSSALGASKSAENSKALIIDAANIRPQKTPQGDIIPSSPALSTADRQLIETGAEYKLREALSPYKYDYCIIDTPPSLGILTINALTASDYAIIPAEASPFSLEGISQLANTLTTVRKYCNPKLITLGIVLTRYNRRTVLSRDAEGAISRLAAQIGTCVFESKIRPCNAIVEAQAKKQSIFEYSPRSNASTDYNALIDEILKRGL